MVLDMPNNSVPITSVARLEEKRRIAARRAVSDIGFHYGSLGDNLDSFATASRLATGLKLYLNKTTGGYLLDAAHLRKIYAAWPRESVVLLHVEEDLIDVAIESIKDIQRPIHICHMPSRAILSKIITAKRNGLPVTCGVCPHHLFLNTSDRARLGVYGDMLPSLKTREPRARWDKSDDIDIFESDSRPEYPSREEGPGSMGVPDSWTTTATLATNARSGHDIEEHRLSLNVLPAH